MSAYLTEYTDISRALGAGLSRQAEQLERLTAQIHFADRLRALHPDRAAEWEKCILEAGRVAEAALRDSAVDLQDVVARGEEALSPIGQTAREYELLCVSHAHIDMNWMWSWPETVAMCNDTFDTMLKLMAEFPAFIFSQSQASVYRAMEQYSPAVFEAIRQRVAEGRWEVTASQWVEGDKNMSSGESITRHLLYTREYIQEKFGLSPEDVTLDYESDTFGHPATLPEITGERNFVFTGCYTSQARQKWANRHNENLLYTAEAAAVIGQRLAGVEYPGHNLDEAWRHVLFDQFHDILPGSGVRDTRHYAMAKAQEGQAAGGMARTIALRGLARRVNTEALRQGFRGEPEAERKEAVESDRAGGAGVGHGTGAGGESTFCMSRTSERAFLAFNPLPYPRREVVEAKLWDTELDRASLVVTGEGVDPQPVQVLGDGNYWGHTFVDVAFPVEVPPLGYRAVCISDRAAELDLKKDEGWEPWGGAGDSWRQLQAADDSLENDRVRAVIDPGSGGLTSLVEKATGREWVPAGKRSGRALRYLSMSAYCFLRSGTTRSSAAMRASVSGTDSRARCICASSFSMSLPSWAPVSDARSTARATKTADSTKASRQMPGPPRMYSIISEHFFVSRSPERPVSFDGEALLTRPRRPPLSPQDARG